MRRKAKKKRNYKEVSSIAMRVLRQPIQNNVKEREREEILAVRKKETTS